MPAGENSSRTCPAACGGATHDAVGASSAGCGACHVAPDGPHSTTICGSSSPVSSLYTKTPRSEHSSIGIPSSSGSMPRQPQPHSGLRLAHEQ